MALTKSLSFSLGRKRILISSNNSCNLEHFCTDFEPFAPMKRRCSKEQFEEEQVFEAKRKNERNSSLLEALPEEILIKVICGVNHDDLKQLFRVSRTIRDATIIAKKSHFAYSTPSKIKVFRNSTDLLNDPMNFEDYEAPNAPKQARKMNRPRLSKKKLGDISVALFTGDEEENWTRRNLFM